MRYVLMMILGLLSFSTFAVENGEFYRIPFGTHIIVLNEDGINNSNDNIQMEYDGYDKMRYDFEFGDTCYAKGGSAVTVLAVKGEKTLVKYRFVGNLAIANMCPSGAIYFIKTETIKAIYAPIASHDDITFGTIEENARLEALKTEVRAMLAESKKQ